MNLHAKAAARCRASKGIRVVDGRGKPDVRVASSCQRAVVHHANASNNERKCFSDSESSLVVGEVMAWLDCRLSLNHLKKKDQGANSAHVCCISTLHRGW